MKSIAVISLLASAAWAQSLIPTGISSNCTQFLDSLDQDTSLSSCTSALLSATSAFGPGASSTPSSSAISSALDTLCSSSSACSETTVRSTLADFYSSCLAELTSNVNNDVVRNYDVLYSLIPFTKAICTKDDSGDYCVTNTSSNSSPPDVSSLYTTISGGNARRDQTPLSVVPNTQTFQASNILFLLLQPTTPTAELCQTCTRNILAAFTSFESDAPYALGLSQSPLLKGQSALYTAVENNCPSGFLNGGVQAAGGSLSGGVLGDTSNGAARGNTPATVGVLVGAAVMGAVAMF